MSLVEESGFFEDTSAPSYLDSFVAQNGWCHRFLTGTAMYSGNSHGSRPPNPAPPPPAPDIQENTLLPEPHIAPPDRIVHTDVGMGNTPDAQDDDDEDEEDEEEETPVGESVLSFGDSEPSRALQLAIGSLVTITAFLNKNDLETMAKTQVDLNNHALEPFHNTLSSLVHSWAHSSGKATIPITA
ncbi:uncharacterized protein STEHIDRAFT_110629 [Stereum hirsutum FP-91666 SS1]|uniref:uncharacterized protein n=1 Tax=Stereum hirsutum (strain FP-91666) TaxID=721885 RepID=UPI000440F1D6|nr:uncharacterized protein STEHIDRAFT_110629 [Stereum hirsutum FP-91666 SS1]EIM87407.1 hypothetical protein STEHIDRAFT_110629 [Stereum hirsutum FP-91666 SS1]